MIDYLNNLAEKSPVARDPVFTAGTKVLDEYNSEPTDTDTMEAIRDEPLRVVPKQTDLSNPLSEPLTESAATTSVVIAAADIDAEAVLLVGSVTVDVPTLQPVLLRIWSHSQKGVI